MEKESDTPIGVTSTSKWFNNSNDIPTWVTNLLSPKHLGIYDFTPTQIGRGAIQTLQMQAGAVKGFARGFSSSDSNGRVEPNSVNAAATRNGSGHSCGVSLPGFESWLHDSIIDCSWTNALRSQNLSFIICKMGLLSNRPHKTIDSMI